MPDSFGLRRGAAIAERYDPAPEDPLGELTATEFGLRRFCYDLNCHIAIEVEAHRESVPLYPDISMLLDDFPRVIAKVATGEEATLAFPENWFTLEFTPSPAGITCAVLKFRYEGPAISAGTSRKQVLHELVQFYRGIIEQAVALGYVEAPEGQQLLAEVPAAQ